ncbi:MAG: ABC-F family ATP-binding cassette domain-containing protein [Candidatus Marinimicrobia bacterium]|nr:ABC-F family ATP-binding cassette domain-containing protein [Candidatus Neomarinimicrobiota bacterium]
MINIDSVWKEFPDKTLFENISFKLSEGMRVGLVGPNGAGKSTLLKIILGLDSPDKGTVKVGKGASIGYLPQEIVVGSEQSIIEEVLNAFPEVSRLEAEIHEVGEAIAIDYSNEKLLEKLTDLHEEFERIDGWRIEDNAKKILSGLGFKDDQFHLPFNTFSGGWRMRVLLAGILLKKPNFLFMDEPTNHLDLEAIIWLEEFLATWKGGLIMISHDRQFLDKSINNVLELDRGAATVFVGNYTRYVEIKEERHILQESAFKNQQKKIAHTEQFIDRFRYKSTKSKQVQSRVKQLDKLDKVKAPESKTSKIRLNIPQPERGPLKVMDLKEIAKSYDDNVVYENLNLAIERGERIGLVGPNGAGKTTLLKMLAGEEKASSGALMYGNNVKVHYFAQHQLEVLDEESTIYRTIASISGGWSETQVRSYLGAFLFSGDTILKKIKVLSGGEKSRLALARMLVEPAHLLLLDEPTNHLDMQSRDIIEFALKNYEGTLVCISHDRHFLNAVTNHTIEVNGGKIKTFNGNYDYYLWKVKNDLKESIKSNKDSNSEKNDKKQAFRDKKKKNNRQRKVKDRVAKIEMELENVNSGLLDPELATDFEKIQSLQNDQNSLEVELLELLEEIEAME